MRRIMIALVGASCLDPGTVQLQGVVVEGWEEGAQPAAGALVTTLDEDGMEVDSATALDSGWYRVEALAGGRAFLRVDGDGLVPAAFSGLSGLNPRLRIPNRGIFAVSTDRWASELETWAGCPGAGEGGSVFGRVDLLDFESGGGGGPVQVKTARLSVTTADGQDLPACYLDDSGDYDPDAEQCGATSRFFIPGVPPGRHTIELEWTPFEGFDEAESYQVWVPEDGLAPRFPLYVTFDPES